MQTQYLAGNEIPPDIVDLCAKLEQWYPMHWQAGRKSLGAKTPGQFSHINCMNVRDHTFGKERKKAIVHTRSRTQS